MIHKTILLVLFAFLRVHSFEEPIPSFPDSFTGVFDREESFFTDFAVYSRHTVAHNAEDKRTFVQISKEGHQDESFWLIYNPPGSDSHTVKGYLEFKEIHRKRKGYWVDYCSYTSHVELDFYPVSPTGKFPSHWATKEGIKDKNWFHFSSDMQFIGKPDYFEEDVKEWDSNSECSVFGRSAVPCRKLIVRNSDPNTPYITQDSFQKHEGTFESDWIQTDTWREFHREEPKITLPWDDWLTTCYNEQNGINISPAHAYVATPRGRDSFKVLLNSSPIRGLGDVTVKLDYSSGCHDCLEFQTKDEHKIEELTFTQENWDVEQVVYVKYKTTGETYFRLVATGGGYDIPHLGGTETASLNLRCMTCTHGTPGYGCDY